MVLSEVNHLLDAWGKARPASEEGPRWHPLVYHSLDVAAVGEVLLEARAATVARIAARLGCGAEALAQIVLFLLAVHDIGKLSRPFQAKVLELWPEQLLGLHPTAPLRDPGHPLTGAWLLQRMLAGELAPLLPRWPPEGIGDLLAPFVGHHGRPVSGAGIFSEREMFGPSCVDAARGFLTTVRELFEPEPLPKPEARASRAIGAASWPLAGLTVELPVGGMTGL